MAGILTRAADRTVDREAGDRHLSAARVKSERGVAQFSVYPRSDCDAEDPRRFSIVAPNGCALPLRPLSEGQATSIADLLNSFLDEWEA